MGKYIDVNITAPSEEEGALIAKTLIEKRLAACVHLIPIRSFYYWENILCDDSEVILSVKTKDYLFRNHIIPTVKSLHSYEVTEILALPIIDGDPDFLKWIDEQVLEEDSQ
jgi:periplasmic divalent cation tolerance protein